METGGPYDAAVPARRRLLVMLVLGLAAAGCGSDDGGGGSAPTDQPGLRFAQAVVVEVRAAGDDGHLVLVAQVPAGAAGCATNLRAEVSDTQASVDVTTRYDIAVALTEADCPDRERRELEVAVSPLGDRLLRIDYEMWSTAIDGATFQKCRPAFGCAAPPDDHCARPWIDHIVAEAELPPERDLDVVGCDGTWLVLDVDAVVTGCQGLDGDPPPSGCAGSGTHVRWFLRFVDEEAGWDVLASTAQDGCAEVVATVPEFPTALCDGAPPS
jgi:hypothetical protein